MNTIKEFLKTNINVAIWTIFYIAAVFIVLFLFFDFNLFSSYDWSVLSNSKLTGFYGFVFWIFLLSVIPIYIATTYLQITTKKPLFKIFEIKKEPEKKSEPEKVIEPEPEINYPDYIPTELRGAFLRSKKNVNFFQSSFDIVDVPKTVKPETTNSESNDTCVLPLPDNFENHNESGIIQMDSDSALPLPDNFDSFTTNEVDIFNDVPKFKEISFDTPVFTDKKTELEIVKHLENNSIEIKVIEDEIVIANGMAIISHSDSDFWIADEENWFANGKQKKSPIEIVLNAAEKNNVKPAIYLAEKNIMDLESKIENWESNGIIIIKDLSELN